MKFGFFFLIAVLAVSCSMESQSRLESALSLAGNNRPELEKVLARYSRVPEDSLKYRTAVFLIENMPGPYYYEGEDLEDYLEFYPLLYDTMRRGHLPVDAVAEIQKKYGYLSIDNLQRREDIQTVDSAYLCENIEWAFKVREEQPWGKSVSFEDFCRYILPYRVGDETLPVWREKYYREFNSILDSLRESTGMEKEDGLTESSFFFYRKGYGGWAGLDFGKRVRVDKIIYSPRNWDNYIKPGCPGRSTVFAENSF